MSLVDLGYATPRVYGGVGVMLDAPSTTVHVERRSSGLIIESPDSLESRTLEDLRAAIGRLEASMGPISAQVTVKTHIPEHVGLGSKTALVLATLIGLRACLNLPVVERDIVLVSQRGRVSGVGIHGFFRGGLLVDCGQPRDAANEPFLPSSAAQHREPSVLSIRIEPPDWNVHLILPRGVRRFEAEEVAFFREATPIPDSEVLSVLASIYHGIVPAALTNNLALFAEALAKLQSCGFKQRELSSQGENVLAVHRALSQAQIGAVGMSSLGPLIYVVTKPELSPSVAGLLRPFDIQWHHQTTFRREGYLLE